MALPYSQACENNKDPILQILTTAFHNTENVFEVGGGTGQHAVHFAAHMPHLRWQSSDQGDYLPGLTARIAAAGLSNLPAPVEFNVDNDGAPGNEFDGFFSANTLHIITPPSVERFFAWLPQLCKPKARLALYGPFKYRGCFTSDSNAAFNQSLQQRNPAMGIRDIEWIIELANAQGFKLDEDVRMPANNQLLIFSRADSRREGGP